MEAQYYTISVSHENYIDLLNGKTIKENVLGDYEFNKKVICRDCSVENMNVSCLCRVTQYEFIVGLLSSGYVLTLQLADKSPCQVSDVNEQRETLNTI